MTAPEHPAHTLIRTTTFDCDIQHCKQTASFLAQIHVIDNCNNPAFRLTPDGNSVHLYCAVHLRAVAQKMGEALQQRLGKLPNGINFAMCATCQRPIATLHDLLDTETL